MQGKNLKTKIIITPGENQEARIKRTTLKPEQHFKNDTIKNEIINNS